MSHWTELPDTEGARASPVDEARAHVAGAGEELPRGCQAAQKGLMPIALSRPSMTCCLNRSSPARGASVHAAMS